MKITKEELVRRLNSERNIANGVEFRPMRKQMARSGNLSNDERELIALAATNSTQAEVAKAFGIAQQTVSNAIHGKSGSLPPNEERRELLRARQDKIKDTALEKLMESLNLITPDKLNDLDAKGLSTVAVNMGKVSGTLATEGDSIDKVHLVVYSPQQRDLSKFRVVEVEQ